MFVDGDLSKWEYHKPNKFWDAENVAEWYSVDYFLGYIRLEKFKNGKYRVYGFFNRIATPVFGGHDSVHDDLDTAIDYINKSIVNCCCVINREYERTWKRDI